MYLKNIQVANADDPQSMADAATKALLLSLICVFDGMKKDIGGPQ